MAAVTKRPGTGPRLWRRLKHYRFAYLLILPTLIGMLMVHFIPTVQGIWMSFLKLNQFTLGQFLRAPFIGLDNRQEGLAAQRREHPPGTRQDTPRCGWRHHSVHHRVGPWTMFWQWLAQLAFPICRSGRCQADRFTHTRHHLAFPVQYLDSALIVVQEIIGLPDDQAPWLFIALADPQAAILDV